MITKKERKKWIWIRFLFRFFRKKMFFPNVSLFSLFFPWFLPILKIFTSKKVHSKTFYTMLLKVFSFKNVTKWEFLAFYFLPWYSNCIRLGILNCSKQRRITFFCNFLQKNEKCYSFFFELSFFLALGERISCQTILLISQSTRRK